MRTSKEANSPDLLDLVVRVSEHIVRALAADPPQRDVARAVFALPGVRDGDELNRQVIVNLTALWAQQIALVFDEEELGVMAAEERALLNAVVLDDPATVSAIFYRTLLPMPATRLRALVLSMGAHFTHGHGKVGECVVGNSVLMSRVDLTGRARLR